MRGRYLWCLRGAGRATEIQERTGLPLDPGFTAGKWRWLLDATPDGAARAAAGEIRLEGFDISGRRISTLASGYFEVGDHEAVWRGRDAADRSVSSGVYFYRLSASGHSVTRKMLLLQ